jgi:hypothetical protein
MVRVFSGDDGAGEQTYGFWGPVTAAEGARLVEMTNSTKPVIPGELAVRYLGASLEPLQHPDTLFEAVGIPNEKRCVAPYASGSADNLSAILWDL